MKRADPAKIDLLVFSDLDGTLLDHHTYSLEPARPALEALKRRGVPLALCSSKTRAEMAPLWEELGLETPFIVENGGGVFAPEKAPLDFGDDWRPAGPGWLVRRLGLPIQEVRRRFAAFRERFGARGFGDMSDAEAAELTGLDLESAARARRREFNEPVWLPRAEAREREFREAARRAGLETTRGGRFFHLLGGGDKGRAVELVAGLYRRRFPGLRTMALGDSPNDLPMLAAVDHAVLLALPGGGHADLDLAGLERQALPGPWGWRRAVTAALAESGPA